MRRPTGLNTHCSAIESIVSGRCFISEPRLLTFAEQQPQAGKQSHAPKQVLGVVTLHAVWEE